ncbi:hypothetical protein Enr10x_52700 [Gimesia panareensis]|uniref:Uncharacterized protein n=1 Tax=Gimesia panareensis TaxID=2527978 RepID=A0A517QE53_9PLAN|nr:hypothetical protein [Gimesia panareensis]QDT29913.1 hypothetical protein Enr10x_52700 [Gimesia panareensis]
MIATDAFDNYWSEIRLSEDYLKTYGHNECFDYEDRSHSSLVYANREVQKHLKSVSQLRMFDGPGENERFSAQNFHEALIDVLNPPERWFRQFWVLNSPEYLALKSGAKNDEDLVLHELNSKTAKPHSDPEVKKKRSAPAGKERFGQNTMLLLHFLLSHHGCNSDNPNNSYLSQSQITKKINEEGIKISQPTVSRSLDSLMREAPSFGRLNGAKKYKLLCEQNEICGVLSGLQVKSNQYLDRELPVLLGISDENIDLLHEKGY